MDVPIAVFDLDKTLTVRDCVVPFMLRSGRAPRVLSAVIARMPRIISMVIRRDRDALKALFVRIAFSGLSVEDVNDQGVEFADVIAASWMRHDVAERLRWHQDQDHVVLLVTASLAPYAEPLGDLLEVDGVLCTRLASVDGVYTGELDGSNCRGTEKVNRIRQWCIDSGISPESVQFAYGDSAGDGPMLALASHGVLVGRRDVGRTVEQ